MALQRMKIDGYGQLELNLVSFRRTGAIVAQCALNATDFKTAPAENGMLLAVDEVNHEVKFDKDGKLPVALNYSTEHMYDERHNALKDFCLKPGEFYPRLGYVQRGDKFTTNCIAYDDEELAGENDEGLITALKALKETPLYGKACANGGIQVTKTETGAPLMVIEYTTMPDGQPAVKFLGR